MGWSLPHRLSRGLSELSRALATGPHAETLLLSVDYSQGGLSFLIGSGAEKEFPPKMM